MRTIYYFKPLLLSALFIFYASIAKSQTTDIPPAGFDVIITNNGDIIHGKVVEVGLMVIKYKRTDIPDGPMYEIPRNEVYAISYRNQLKEYFSPVDYSIFGYPEKKEKQKKKTQGLAFLPENEEDTTSWTSNIPFGDVRVGFGSIRNISKVSDVDQYKGEYGFPGIFISYIFPFRQNLDLGIAMGWARFKYTHNEFSEYDMLSVEKTIKESLLSLSVVGRYSFTKGLFTPYIFAGVSYINSNVKSEGNIEFTEDGRSVVVQGGGRTSSPGILLRAGTEVKITDEISAYADFGTGLTLIQLGGVYKLRKK